MPTNNRKQPSEMFPLKLTDKQRESLVLATRPTGGLKKKIEGISDGTRVVEFTRKELEQMGEEVDTSLSYAPAADRKRLNAVLDKIDDILVSLDEEHLEEKRRKAGTKSGTIYQLKVTLKEVDPPVWRRIQVPDCTLGQFHEVLQAVMGWDNSHLHQFIIRGEYYGPRPPDGMDLDMEYEDEEEVLLSQVARTGRKGRFVYEYDFGDSWKHEILLEKTVEPEPKVEYPRCVEGANACPPEDCGGPWGYADLLEVLADPKHERHRELKEWVGGKFDPKKFSLDNLNKELRTL
jgi:hypothetical protein